MSNRRSRMPKSRVTALAALAVSLPLALAAPALAVPAGPRPPASTAVPATGSAAAAAPAPHGRAVPAIPTGSVVQNGVPELTGAASPVTTRFTATLPAGTTGRVSALLAFDPDQLPGAGVTSWRVATRLHASCSVNRGPYQACDWTADIPSDDDPLASYLRVPLPAADAGGTITYDVRMSADYGALPEDQLLHGWMEVTDADGNALAVGGAQIQYRTGVMPAAYRGALYARDTAGVLWRYEGNDTYLTHVPLKPRARVGGGWNAYTAIVPLGGQSADAQGDLVARDKAGVLWYYAHSGNPAQPFKSRVKVGGGWNAYTALSAISGERYRAGDLVARDRSGTLWRYRATGNPARPFAARLKVGGGWNAYTSITAYGGGVVARDAAGVLWSYWPAIDPHATDPFMPRLKVGGGWNAYTAFSGTMIGHYGSGDSLFARDRSGRLWWYDEAMLGVPGARTSVGAGWNIYTVLF